jgi:uncharacterized membrane protein
MNPTKLLEIFVSLYLAYIFSKYSSKNRLKMIVKKLDLQNFID